MSGPQPGRLDQRVTFRRRGPGPGGPGTGELVDAFSAWGSWRPLSAAQLVEGQAVADAVAGTLTIPDTPRGRQLGQEDRALLAGSDLMVVSAPIPDRSGFLTLQLSRRAGGT